MHKPSANGNAPTTPDAHGTMHDRVPAGELPGQIAIPAMRTIAERQVFISYRGT